MLFSWLLARHFDGSFIFRIEDTDRTRLVPESVKSMLEDVSWLGLDIDEGPSLEELRSAGYDWPGAVGFGGKAGPYIQSLRLHRYREVAAELVKRGFAYRCDCSPERLEAERQEQLRRGLSGYTGYSGYCRDRNASAGAPHVVRFRMPENEPFTFYDAIRRDITWNPIVLRDTVILKTDGFPTYHLASTVDDHDMRVSHVLRGEEWISTTPLHCLISRSMGWTMPVVAHLPVVLGTDGKKLSKRHGAAFCSAFRDQGCLPEALLNFLVLNGWAPGEGSEQELFARAELIANFSLDRVKAASAIFSYDKLRWMNGVYIRQTPDNELARRVAPFLVEAGLDVDYNRLLSIMPHVKERMTTSLKDAIPQVEFLFVHKVRFELDEILALKITPNDARRILSAAQDALSSIRDYTASEIEEALRELPKRLHLSPKAVFMTIRLAATGRKVTPPLFESLSVLGRERTLQRFKNAIDLIAPQP